jgi:hypothetical protein
MIFTLRLDESNTDGPAPDLVMAGLLGSSPQWKLLLRRLHALQREYGFTTFHATDFRRRKSAFRGWTRQKCSDLIGALAKAIRAEICEILSITVTHAQYVAEYRDVPAVRGEMHLSQYGICFEACLARAVEIVRGQAGRHRLNVELESGHKNAGAARAIFAAMKKELEARGVFLLGEVRLVKKADSEGLMFADYQAHASLLSDRRERAGGLGYSQLTNGKPRNREAGLTFIQYRPGTLREMKARKAAIAQARRAPRNRPAAPEPIT